ncbi:hypothetical protein AMAG_12289 [Allomyces macrogynus ATCC 38327]|uniref:Enoyl-CoA hydratase/isomerase n=1 Tax=Allomyces macrogynus (strain ATCC 38327) TaxID=578462 RepID=A0A0L0SXD0_ALLM3|nr:hypothetical protein AMAG_12289 [Allomyces macrogynus ATCC 38327]|eukprot:KNE67218.1 hypothetical protein AMAG_12289 [Allomyces macrogynus ATCC 38327]
MAAGPAAAATDAPLLVDRTLDDGRIWLLTLNRSRAGSSIDTSLATSLISTVRDAELDPVVRILVLTGRGKYFCTGMNLGSAGQLLSTENDDDADLFDVLRCSRVPTVAALNGPALGGGVGLFLACDLRVATRDAYLALPEVRRGLVPARIGPIVVEMLGLARAKSLAITAARMPVVPDLVGAGIVVQVVDDAAQVVPAAVEMARSVVLGALGAVLATRKLFDAVAVHARGETGALGNVPEVRKCVRQAFAKMMGSEEAAEGIQAFMARRAPSWAPQEETAKGATGAAVASAKWAGKAKL